jgi:acylphosphatase
MERIRVAVRVRGMVQGVGFRYFTHRTARSLDLTGWVKNLPDGTVAAVFEGPRSDVEAAVEALRRGPAGSRVERMEVDRQVYRGEFEGFEVRF